MEPLLQFINQYTNPFGLELSQDHLYNLSQGQSVNNEIYEFLSSVEIEGERQRTSFISESVTTPDMFDKDIKKNKIMNFEYKNTQKVNTIMNLVISTSQFLIRLYCPTFRKRQVSLIQGL